jgi:hypothetical protein
MKRGRTSTPTIAGRLSPAVHAAAKARLEQDYAALVNGTATEDLRVIAARVAAASELLAHLAQLAALAGTDAADETANSDAVLAAARAGMADETKPG